MRFGVCCGTDCFAAAVLAGVDYLEPSVAGVAQPESDQSVWAENLGRIQDTGLEAEAWNCWLPSDLKIVGPAVDWDRYRRYVDRAIPRVREAGGKVIVFGSGGARKVPEGYEKARALDDLARALGIAAAAGPDIVFALEALTKQETNLLNSVADTVAYVRTLNLPNVKCTADFYHMELEDESVRVLHSVGAYVGHAHLADTGRGAPGTGTANNRGFLTALHHAGYDSRVSVEASWEDFSAQIAGAMRFLRDTWTAVHTNQCRTT